MGREIDGRKPVTSECNREVRRMTRVEGRHANEGAKIPKKLMDREGEDRIESN